jgi:glycosyltransferase involved in cell wall biosynthesis
MSKKLLFITSTDWFFLSHRLPIALEAMKQGYEVHIAAAISDKYDVMVKYGLIVHPLPLKRGSMNPFAELKTLFAIWQLFRKVRPDIAHLVTIKPILYGGIAARFAPVNSLIAAVPGLGFVFNARGIKATIRRWVVAVLYFMALRQKNIKVIFQNPDDKKQILAITGLPEIKTIMIRGSGVDLSLYSFSPLPEGAPIIVMAARLLRDKGVREFVEAASILKNKGHNARFCLVGEPDLQNPSSITQAELNSWKAEGNVESWGYRADIPQIFADAYMVVLPSYSEGLPKVLIEAAACGRAVVTTDVPGCREAIEADITGLLVPVKDVNALADAIEKLLIDKELCRKMGNAGRNLAEKEFDIKSVVAVHMDIYNSLTKQ